MEDHPDYADRTPFTPTVTGSIEGIERPPSPISERLEPPPIQRQNASTQANIEPPTCAKASYGGPGPGDPFLDNLPVIIAAVGLAFVVGMFMSDFISKPTNVVAACCE